MSNIRGSEIEEKLNLDEGKVKGINEDQKYMLYLINI